MRTVSCFDMLKGILLASAVALGCGNEPREGEETQAPVADGVQLAVHSEQEVSGTFTFGDAKLDFAATEESEGVIQLRYATGDLVVTSTIDQNAGLGTYDSNGVAITAEHRELLVQFAGQLAGVLPAQGVRTAVENALSRQTSHLASAPKGEVIPSFVFVAERGWTHLPCYCAYAKLLADETKSNDKCHFGSGSSPASSCSYYYVSAGNRYWFITGKYCNTRTGAYEYDSCRGRCGVGCGWDNVCNYFGTGTYTFDCAEHDVSIAGWTQASDDYSFSSYNCCS